MQGPDADSDGPFPLARAGIARARELLKFLRHYTVPRRPEYAPKRWRRVYLLACFVARRFAIEDKGAGMAATLTIHTLLSTVPILGVALLVVGLMSKTEGQSLLYDLFRSIVPETSRADAMAQGAMDLASHVTISNLGAWGFLVTLSIAFVLFSTLERTFNHIWRVERRRSLLTKFTMFYTLATLGPLVMLYSLLNPILPGMKTALGVPLITGAVSLIALNRFLPYAEVRWRGALIAGLLSASLLELGKFGFGFYATRFALSTYEGVYGPLAILPVLVVWTYLSWTVVLAGAEIAYVIQHRRAIALLGYMNRYVLDRLATQRPSGRTAARLLLAICTQYSQRNVGLGAESLASRFGVGLDVVGEILSRLRRAELILETDSPTEVFVPARPLDQIGVLEVVALFDRDHSRNPREDDLTEVFSAIDAQREQDFGELTFAALVSATRTTTTRETN